MYAVYSREGRGKEKRMKNHDRARVESYFALNFLTTARVGG